MPFTDREKQRAHTRDSVKRWREAHPLRAAVVARSARLRYEYGITVEQYSQILAAQGGCCAICKTSTPPASHGTWLVDHDHTTGAVRGLLCNSCNNGLGRFRDDPDLLRAAAQYLSDHQAPAPAGRPAPAQA